ncbi:murein transglycosylase A [Dongia deserti]|uniref:murein transglycosylase A n=1 Tax=Dongia deserti TaxID=2268030 RepID=UPI002549127B|nr:MltA domain-containing protein [Dongia deserti]
MFILAACVPTGETPLPHLVELSRLPGWQADASFQAYPALLASCGVIATLSSDKALGIGGSPTEWREACDAIAELRAALVADPDQALRRTLEAHFVALDPGAGTSALVTGYYEPELKGSRIKDAAHPHPLYRLPPNPTQYDRAEIDGGAFAGKKLELLWVNDRVEAFFLQVQGSGRVRLENGEVVRVGFAGTNERQYVSIGKAMVDAGIMTKEEASLQTIRAYLNAHPDEIDSWLHRNPRYVFFKEAKADPNVGPLGALGVPLTPGRSIAVDPAFVPLGLPVWLDTTIPKTNAPLQRLAVAQDKGGAIKGPGRIDLFWGAGEEAEAMAGPMRQQGTYWVIVPRAVGERWLRQQAGS